MIILFIWITIKHLYKICLWKCRPLKHQNCTLKPNVQQQITKPKENPLFNGITIGGLTLRIKFVKTERTRLSTDSVRHELWAQRFPKVSWNTSCWLKSQFCASVSHVSPHGCSLWFPGRTLQNQFSSGLGVSWGGVGLLVAAHAY